MRVISGDWKGRRLKTVKGLETRPTSDKVKGAVFNILGSKVINAKVLDLFAGTGSLSLEALSRGALSAVLVEKNNSAWEILMKNILLTNAQERTRVLKTDAYSYLEQNKQEKFDLIFLDPPYRRGMADKVLSYLCKNTHLNPAGVIIIETASEEIIPQAVWPLEIMITKEYGDTKIWFLQEAQEQGEG